MGSNPLGGEGPLALLTAISKNDISSMDILDLSVSVSICGFCSVVVAKKKEIA